MLTYLLFGFSLSTIVIVIRLWPLIFSRQEREIFIKDLDIIYMTLEWFFMLVTFSTFASISSWVESTNYILTILVSILFVSLFVSYDYFAYPIMILLRKGKFKTSEFYEKWAKETVDKNIRIRVLNQDKVNAYATGILSFHKVILLNDKLMVVMNECDVKNLIYHEYAHLKLNHLLILYVSNILCCSISIISYNHFGPIFEKTESPGLFVALHGALLGGFCLLVVGLVQRQLEYRADKYASNIVGTESYTRTLENLNTATNGGLEKKAINYPVLIDRIKYVTER